MDHLSVVIIAFNEEEHIGRCIDSVKPVADEILVLDSLSTDRTAEIARSKGAVVHRSSFLGYIAQKNHALTLAANDHVLSLDADEELSPELMASVLAAKGSFSFKAYKMPRRAYYCGKFIYHGSWYPEPKVRLFDRRAVKWGGQDPHDRIIVPASMAVGRLRGDLLHYICDTIGEHEKRNENFSTIAARSMHAAGKKASWFKMIGSPVWFFLFDYFIRGGFLSGKQGWWIATRQAKYHYQKYNKLRLMRPIISK